MTRPGPSFLPPGQAPGGVVFRVYSPAGTMLVERVLRPGDDLDANARWDSMKTQEAFPMDRKIEVCIVCFDGDTGMRWTDEDWETLVSGMR